MENRNERKNKKQFLTNWYYIIYPVISYGMSKVIVDFNNTDDMVFNSKYLVITGNERHYATNTSQTDSSLIFTTIKNVQYEVIGEYEIKDNPNYKRYKIKELKNVK